MVAHGHNSNFRDRLQQEWQHANGWQWWLLPLSWLYRMIVILRRLAYRAGWLASDRLAVPVVVIGNLTVGGTGKTPLTIWLARQLSRRGIRAGILLRGHGGRHTAPQAVLPDSDPTMTGDEAILLARQTGVPVWCGRDRAATGRAMLASHADLQLILCDDGLQHLSLARDMEIVVIDGERGFGNGRLLPAGPLREPATRLANVDAIVINQPLHTPSAPTLMPDFPAMIPGVSTPPTWRMTLVPGQFHNLAHPDMLVNSDHFRGQPLHAVAGIGHPDRFFRQLAAHGLNVERHPFPDHHPYQANELDFAGNIIMTEKDAVKCMHFATKHMWAWPVDAEVDERLVETLLTKTGVRHG